MTPRPEQERRLVLRVLSQWQQACGDRDRPAVADIDGALFGDDWANCFIVGLPEDGEPVFLYVGDVFAGPGWADIAGRRVAECPEGTLLRAAASFIPGVLARGIPMSHGGPGFNFDRPILFRSILLPLSEDGVRIDALLGAANYREKVVREPNPAQAIRADSER
jgi:hypothetical protein